MKKFTATILALLLTFSAAALSLSSASSPEPLTAEYEDSSVDLWFASSSAKVKPTDTVSTGLFEYTVHLAKNEIEDCQLVLMSDTAHDSLTAQITDFTNASGDVIDTSLYIEYYLPVTDGALQPDPIPPLSPSDTFSLTVGQTQTLLIKLKTADDTPEGAYSAVISIYNAAGQQIKCANVYADVWNFALSEETACATSMNLDSQLLQTYHSGVTDIYKTYYDYLLENRVCAYNLPVAVYKPGANEYMDNPRVTSFQMSEFGSVDFASRQLTMAYTKVAANDTWFDKAYFSNVVDPLTIDVLNQMKSRYETIYSGVSSAIPASRADKPFNFISTFFSDITVDDAANIDQIKFMSDYVNLWCPKPFAYTSPTELSSVAGAKIVQDARWDALYGTFDSRMASFKQNGDKLWWFVSWDTAAPYANMFTQTDGVTHRALFWQQKLCDVDGFLCNYANFWYGANPWETINNNSNYPDVYGESVLVYPGSNIPGRTTVINGPVGSLKLEAIRDGIEDYQYMTMLEDIRGDGAADTYINPVTTGVLTYTTDDDTYQSARIELGNAVEAAVNGTECMHEYTSAETTPATCTHTGIMTYTCSLCGDSYTEEIMMSSHTYSGTVTTAPTYTAEGVMTYTCSVCGATYTESVPKLIRIKGDITGDGKVNALDLLRLKLNLTGKITLAGDDAIAADTTGDSKINGLDLLRLKLYLTAKITTF